MTMPRPLLSKMLLTVAAALVATQGANAQTANAAQAEGGSPLFAIEITIGPNWIADKPPQDQQHFREHSANLQRLRESGALILGARYSDKGFVVLTAKDESHARAMMDEDPSMKAGVFQYRVYSFNVFYGGTVDKRP